MNDIIEKYEKYNYNNRFLFAICSVITVSLFARDVGGIALNKYILMVLAVIGMPFLTYSNFISLLSFLFALTFGIPSNYIYVAAVIVLICRHHFVLDKSSVLMFGFFFITEFALSSIFSSNMSIVTYVGYFSRLFLLFLFIRENDSRVDYSKAIKYFIYGVIVFCILLVLIYLKTNTIESILSGRMRLGETTTYELDGMKMRTNSNNIAYFCVSAMALALFSFQKTKKSVWVILFFLLFALGSFTVSKTFFMLSALLILVYINNLLFNKGISAIKRIAVLIILGVGIYILLNLGTFGALLMRFEKVDYVFQDARTVIFKGYWDAFWNNPAVFLFGAGAFTHREVLFPAQSTHSGLEQILVSYGTLGFIVFVGYLIWNFHSSYVRTQGDFAEKIIYITPLLIVVLFSQTIQFLNPSDLMLPYIVAMWAIKAAGNSEEY